MHFEVRYAVRQLLKSPGFTLVAIVGLGLGIGANVALFSVDQLGLPASAAVSRTRTPGQIDLDRRGDKNLMRAGFSYPRFLEVQERQQVFSDLALSAGNAFTLTGRADPEQVIGLHASASLLPALGLQPVIGRNFSAERGSARRRARRPHQPADLAGAIQR